MGHILDGECFVSEPIVMDKTAPDFTAEAYYRGQKIDVRLSDFRNQWVVLFFYKADFTFV
ncbi:AhpC/TSA family protein [Desulfotomaculum arcticum]|uniref:AhpC/TSA family protein n=2 Tax=Desulfotruncus TaxID=2867377 RepID=A0A1I2U2Y0_9FIRM|nr:AhpC/TSA family protein [Desulfotomaculum arcticum] [Desulfotruncus arcticus DSM 17038]